MAGNKELEKYRTCRTVSVSSIFRLEPAERAEKFTSRARNAWASDTRKTTCRLLV